MTDLELKMQMRQALDASMPSLPDDPLLTARVLDLDAQRRRIGRSRRRVLRVAVALAVLVLAVCGGLLAHGSFDIEEWVENDQYGEWHIFRATNINTPTIGTAEAAVPFKGDVRLKTEDWDEFVSTLGWTPRVPAWLPDGWKPKNYQVSDIEPFCSAAQLYDNLMSFEYIVITQTVFRDLETMDRNFHQDEEGEYVKLENGLSIYIAPLGDGYNIYWIDGITDYVVYIPLEKEDALHVIRSMYGFD